MFRTVRSVYWALHIKGGYLEKKFENKTFRYAPHLTEDDKSRPYGFLSRTELLEWAKANLLANRKN